MYILPGDVITDKTAPKLLEHNIKMVVEAANLPTVPNACEYLHKAGVWIIPDFIANAGGVIGSFVEYQGRTEKEAFELIKCKIVKAVRNILTEAIVREENPRTLATEMSEQGRLKCIVWTCEQEPDAITPYPSDDGMRLVLQILIIPHILTSLHSPKLGLSLLLDFG